MSIESMLMFILTLILVPVLLIASNDTLFFMVLGVILVFAALKSLHSILFGTDMELDESEPGILDEIEDLISFDLNRFRVLYKNAKSILVIVFFVYCTFYLNPLWLKFLCAFVIVYWLGSIKHNLKIDINQEFKDTVPKLLVFLVDMSSLILISFSAYYKFFAF
jgi:hypothetical protein